MLFAPAAAPTDSVGTARMTALAAGGMAAETPRPATISGTTRSA